VYESSDVGAVGTVGAGEECLLGVDGPVGIFIEHGTDEEVVLLGLDAAGGIDDPPARTRGGEGGAEDVGLDDGHTGEGVRGEAVSRLDASAEDAGVGAGDVGKDGVEPAFHGIGDVSRVADGGADAADAEASSVLLDEGDAGVRDVESGDLGLVARELGEVSGFSARGGAEVEDFFAPSGAKSDGGAHGGDVLDIELARGEGLERRELDGGEDAEGVLRLTRCGAHAQPGEGGLKPIVRGLEGVDADGEGRAGVGGFEDAERTDAAEMGQPALDEPSGDAEGGLEVAGEVGVGARENLPAEPNDEVVIDGKVGGRRLEAPTDAEGLFDGAEEAAKDGVGEGGGLGTHEPFGEIHGFADACVGGDGFHEKDLAGPGAEDVEKHRLELAERGLGKEGEEMVEGEEPADDGGGEVGCGSAQTRREVGALELGGERVLEENAGTETAMHGGHDELAEPGARFADVPLHPPSP